VTARRNARYTPIAADGPLPRQMLGFMAELVESYGDAVALPLPRPVVILNDPAAVQHVLIDNARNYTKNTIQYGALSAVTGLGLLTSDGDHWRRHRRIAQPAFHHDSLNHVAAQAAAAAARISGRWSELPPGAIVDVDRDTMQATLEVVGHTLFAADLAEPGQRLVRAVGQALAGVIEQARLPLPDVLRPVASRRQRRAIAVLDEACAEIVEARRQQGTGGDGGTDLLAQLLHGAAAGQLTDTEIRDELVTMVIAGHETVASALTWTLHLLAQHPAIQDEVAAEAAQALAGQTAGSADLAALPQLRAVVAESLRLFPPAWVVTRRAIADDCAAGVALPAGTLVIMSPWLLHRRPLAWPNPQTFDPDRFAAAGATRPRSDYLPFGAGPRLCIGRDFALVETVLCLANLLPRHRLLPQAGGRPVQVEALVTLRPRHGLPLAVSPRPGFMMEP
jgi:cytochrome P450